MNERAVGVQIYADSEPEIGGAVTIAGMVIAKTDYKDGPPSYWVEFNCRGKLHREWMRAEDFAYDGFDDVEGA